jgi:hypothetical protein
MGRRKARKEEEGGRKRGIERIKDKRKKSGGKNKEEWGEKVKLQLQ